MKKQNVYSKLFYLVLAVFLGGCASNEPVKEEFYLVTKLGADTLAVEKVIVSVDSIESHALLRSPKLRELDYGLSLNPDSEVLLRGVIRDGSNGELISTQFAQWDGDSLTIDINAGERSRNISAGKDILPFIDMVHWPFNLMLQNANMLASGESKEQLLWSGTRSMKFVVTRISPDSMTLKHPSRGIMGVTVDEAGNLVALDAGNTTRKLIVTREATLDYDGLKSRFMALEKSGKSFGALSGRGKTEKEVNGVNYLIDFGTPEKRGRDIWGGIVAYGERWRTGANRATHFKTDKDIKLGELEVPAGQYTFFSIPQESSLTLIVNKQTGQNGQSYDDSQDLGITDMTAVALDEVVEVFTIDVVEREGKAFLSLQWDKKAYEVEISN